MAKKGRPKRRASTEDTRAPAMWGRVVQIGEEVEALRAAEHAIADPRLATMLYRLKLYGHISELEYQTGWMVAEIYGLHDRLVTGAKRHAASPSYDKGWSKGEAVDPERMSVEAKDADDRRARRAQRRWNRVQGCLGEAERAVVEDVCVFDRAAPASLSDLLADALTTIATEFGVFNQAKERARAAPRAKKPGRTTARTSPRAPGAPRPVSREKTAFLTTMRHARPDMDDQQLEDAWHLNEAVKDRARFRSDKERASATP